MAQTPGVTRRKRTAGAEAGAKKAGKAVEARAPKGKDRRSKEKGTPRILPLWFGKAFKSNWKSWTALLATFFMGLFLRAYFYYQRAFQTDPPQLSGNDPFYHKRVVDFIQETYTHLHFDSLLNYPLELVNPRPPVFDWSIAISGITLSPFFGGDVGASTWWVMEFAPAFWGAMAVFPVYFLAKDMFGRRAAIIAAVLIAITPSNIERSPLGFSDHDAMVVFFVITTFFFLSRAYGNIRGTRWVDKWFRPADITRGFMEFIRTNRIAMLYALLAGFSLATIALMWEGFGYVVVIIMVCFLVQLVFNRFRNEDSMGIFMVTMVALLAGMFVALPYFFSYSINTWMNPFVIVVAMVIAGVFMVPTRDYPWIMILPMVLAVVISAYYLLSHFAPEIAENLFTGGGYFVKSKLYSTIAEAQAPDMSRMIFSYGPVTYFLTFIGLVMAAISIPKHWRADYILIIVWSGVAVFMALSAVRFMFNATPVFAIMAGWVLSEIIERTNASSGIKKLDGQRWYVHIYIGLATLFIMLFSYQFFYIQNGKFWIFEFVAMVGFLLLFTTLAGLYVYFRYDHRVGLLVIFLVPVIWYIWSLYNYGFGHFNDLIFRYAHVVMAIAMVPGLIFLAYYWQSRRPAFEFRQALLGLFICILIILPNSLYAIDAAIPYEDKTVYDPARQMTGSFGHSFTSEYWLDGMEWLADQDGNMTYEERPGFMSWWDYGFWAIEIGKHPTAADNFQSGYHFAGSMISSQNETQAVALMTTRLLEGHVGDNRGSLSPEVEAILIDHLDGGNPANHPLTDKLYEYLTTKRRGEQAKQDLIKTVNGNPDKYGKYITLKFENAMYGACRELLVGLGEEGVVDLYHDIQVATGKSLRYFAVDSRLFPFSAENTGIFYAPIKLADRDVNEYLAYIAVTEDGRRLDSEALEEEAERNPDLRVKEYELDYLDPFYNSLFYRAYIGYRAEDVGLTYTGVPGITGDMARYPAMQGWNMTHFKLEYRTMYYTGKSSENASFPDDYEAMDSELALDIYNEKGGDIKSGLGQGVTFLKYYDGAILKGRILTSEGKPVPGVRVTCQDEAEIPHHSVISDENGRYELILPYGTVKVTVSHGGWGESQPEYARIAQVEQTTLNTSVFGITEDQAMRRTGDWVLEQDIHIPSSSLTGGLYWDLNENENFDAGEADLFGGSTIYGVQKKYNITVEADEYEDGTYTFEDAVPGLYDIYVTYRGREYQVGEKVNVEADKETTKDFVLVPGNITVNVTDIQALADPEPGGITFVLDSGDGEARRVGNTDEFGGVFFSPLLPGNYTVHVLPYSGYAGLPMAFDLAPGENETQNATLTGVRTVNGMVYRVVGGVREAAPYAMVQFHDLDGRYRSVTVFADGSGRYTAEMPNGTYGAYARFNPGKGVMAGMGLVEVEPGRDAALDLELEPTSEVNGTVLKGAGIILDEDVSAEVSFVDLGTGAVVKALTNVTGQFSADLPIGEYTMRIDHLTVTGRVWYSYITPISIVSSGQLITKDILVEQATLVRGIVHWDRDGDGEIDGYDWQGENWGSITDDPLGPAGEGEGQIGDEGSQTPPVEDLTASSDGTRQNDDEAGGENGAEGPGEEGTGPGNETYEEDPFEGPYNDIVLEGAVIRFHSSNGTYETVTNASGFYRIRLATGSYQYVIEDPRVRGEIKGRISVGTDVGNDTTENPPALDIAFNPHLTKVQGSLLYQEPVSRSETPSEPIPLADALVTMVGLTPGTENRKVETDNTGVFIASDLPPGYYNVTVGYEVEEAGAVVNYTLDELLRIDLEGMDEEPVFMANKTIPAVGQLTLPNGTDAVFPTMTLLTPEGDVRYEILCNKTGYFNETVDVGNYTVWVQLSQHNETFVYHHPARIAPGYGRLDLTLEPGVRVSGDTVVYADAARTELYKEVVSGTDITFSLDDGVDVTTTSKDGNYSAILYPNTQYRVTVDYRKPPKPGEEKSWYRFSGRLTLGTDERTYHIEMEKLLNISGVLYYDADVNAKYDEAGDEELANATVTFHYMGPRGSEELLEDDGQLEEVDSHTVTTNASGGYYLWLPLGNHTVTLDDLPGFRTEPFGPKVTVFAEGVTEDIRARAKKVPVSITAFNDRDSDGERDPGEIIVRAGDISFQPADDEGEWLNLTGMPGEFVIDISPGIYYVHGISDLTGEGGILRAFFGARSFDKGEGAEFPMGYKPGALHRGPVMLTETEGAQFNDITALVYEDEWGEGGMLVKTKGESPMGSGQNRIDVVGGWWQIPLPYGEYSLRLDYTHRELNMDVDYSVKQDITSDENTTLFELELVKEKDLSVELALVNEPDKKLAMAQNDTRVIRFTLENTGNHPNPIEMSTGNLPDGWTAEFDHPTFTLPIGHTAPVNMTLTTSPDALVENSFTVKVGSTEAGGETDQVNIKVNVPLRRDIGVDIVEGTARGVAVGAWVGYNVTVQNSGNQDEAMAINITRVSSKTEGWEAYIRGGVNATARNETFVVEAGAHVNYTVEVRAPNGTQAFPGDFSTVMVFINTTGDDAMPFEETLELRTTVAKLNLVAKGFRVDNLRLRSGPVLNITGSVSATGTEAFDVPVSFYVGDLRVYNESIPMMIEGETVRINFQLNMSDGAEGNGSKLSRSKEYGFRLEVDEFDTLEETDEWDNEVLEHETIGDVPEEETTNWKIVAFIITLAIILIVILVMAWRSTAV